MTQQRYLATPTYLVALALVCIPPFDAMMQAFPLQLRDPNWRLSAVGLVSNGLTFALVGLLIAFVASAMFEHRQFHRVLGVVAIAAAVVTAMVLALFTLDAIQVQPLLQPDAQSAFQAASATGVFRLVLATITFGVFGFASFKAPRRQQRAGLIVNAEPVKGLQPSARPTATSGHR